MILRTYSTHTTGHSMESISAYHLKRASHLLGHRMMLCDMERSSAWYGMLVWDGLLLFVIGAIWIL